MPSARRECARSAARLPIRSSINSAWRASRNTRLWSHRRHLTERSPRPGTMQTNMSALRPVRGITRAISVSRPPVIRWRSPNKVAFNGNSEVTINDPQANAGDTSPGRSPQPLQGLQMGRASLEAAKARQRPRRPDASHRHTGGAGMPTDPYWWVRLLHGKRFAANIGVSIEPAVEAGARSS